MKTAISKKTFCRIEKVRRIFKLFEKKFVNDGMFYILVWIQVRVK